MDDLEFLENSESKTFSTKQDLISHLRGAYGETTRDDELKIADYLWDRGEHHWNHGCTISEELFVEVMENISEIIE